MQRGVKAVPHHGYHQVDASPWPALTALCIQWLTVSAVMFFHQYNGAGTILLFAFFRLRYTASLWWRDVTREGILAYHTAKVVNGLQLGMILFIVSEAVFFVGLQWRFMHRRLMPTIQVGMTWPPVGVVPLHWTGLPKTNTQIQLASYFTANAAKHALDNYKKNLCGFYLLVTIGLGVLFMYCQYVEYTSASFTFSDTVYGSAFYLTTGFHGFHVLIGAIYQAVCYVVLPSTTPTKAVAFNQAVTYWHFVDIVWRQQQVLLYVWGSALPAHEIDACADGLCALSVVLSDRKAHLFLTASINFLIFHYIIFIIPMFSFFKVYRDRPVAWGMYQQDPATSVMEGIRDLNRDIHFFLIVILIQVLWLIFRIVYRFHHKSMPVPERFNHHTSLELVWAILPSVIVTAIALPSLSQIFTYDDLVAKPMLTVKVVGRQWYWQYALRESVDFSLRKQREILLQADSNSIYL